MNDLASLVRAAASLEERGAGFVLATVVKIEGSSYRRPGARLLLTEDGVTVGSVSGGCLERDLRQKAAWHLGEAQATLVSYDRREEQDDEADDEADEKPGRAARAFAASGEKPPSGTSLRSEAWRVGCQGRVDILLERLHGAVPLRGVSPVAFLAACVRRERPGVLVTIFRSTHPGLPVGLHLGWQAAGLGATTSLEVVPATVPAAARALLEAAVEKAFADERSATLAAETDGERWEAFVEVVQPPLHLYVFGSGEDAVPLVSFARGLGWRVSVSEPHPQWSTRDRFVAAHDLLTEPLRLSASRCAASPCAAAVLMSHDYTRDRETLGVLLEGQARYIGVLGPARRTARMLADLRATGHLVRAEAEERLYAPVGLAVGAETPEEIALAVVAEIQAVMRGARPRHAREGGPLHEPGGALASREKATLANGEEQRQAGAFPWLAAEPAR